MTKYIEISDANEGYYVICMNFASMLYFVKSASKDANLIEELLDLDIPEFVEFSSMYKTDIILDIDCNLVDYLRNKADSAILPIQLNTELAKDDKTLLVTKNFGDITLYYFITSEASAGILAKYTIGAKAAYFACQLQIAKEHAEFRSKVASIIAKYKI